MKRVPLNIQVLARRNDPAISAELNLIALEQCGIRNLNAPTMVKVARTELKDALARAYRQGALDLAQRF